MGGKKGESKKDRAAAAEAERSAQKAKAEEDAMWEAAGDPDQIAALLYWEDWVDTMEGKPAIEIGALEVAGEEACQRYHLAMEPSLRLPLEVMVEGTQVTAQHGGDWVVG